MICFASGKLGEALMNYPTCVCQSKAMVGFELDESGDLLGSKLFQYQRYNVQ